ncbi:HNH endonuclease signature motif containing protein [Knoellia aerolata]|uniref:HNH nuclease n=1 Tax=Knoellia aerolata DSM 18566 TaxID=1385519 RepID=A0A0A0K3V5_9MICO|nr:HNH endonuclease signature motif containing protein [Knoellia aerolata]KGN42451.1 HNH nuclease [Knoellia aerolata DSM 18566]
MHQPSTSPVATLRAALEGAREALGTEGLGEALARMSGPELAEVMALTDEVRSRAGASQVRVAAEAAHRGEFSAARRGVGSLHAWVREHAPSLRQSGAGQVAALAQDVACSVPGGLWSTHGPDAGAYADPTRAEGVVWARVVTGEVGPALALTALREVARMKELLVPEAVPTVATAILDHGVQWGAAEAKKIRTSLLAAHGLAGELDDQDRRLRSGAYLSSPQVADGDVTEYRMAMTPEQAATLEAAIGPLSRPAPNDATGERDLRPAGQRRVEALAAVCARAVRADAADGTPGGAATTVHVAMGLDDLRAAGSEAPTGSGQVMVSRAQQTILAPATMRRLACDADVIPVVLGSAGEVLDLGRAVRLFTRPQRRALWHRDRGCSFPGCDMPPGWAEAHHLVHWADGGTSDLDNAALLCQRHHTLVHDRRLVATVHPPDEHGRSVTWDLTRGSYDRVLSSRLEQMRRRRRSVDRLDTGPPDPWAGQPPEHVMLQIAEEFLADHDADAWDLTA